MDGKMNIFINHNEETTSTRAILFGTVEECPLERWEFLRRSKRTSFFWLERVLRKAFKGSNNTKKISMNGDLMPLKIALFRHFQTIHREIIKILLHDFFWSLHHRKASAIEAWVLRWTSEQVSKATTVELFCIQKIRVHYFPPQTYIYNEDRPCQPLLIKFSQVKFLLWKVNEAKKKSFLKGSHLSRKYRGKPDCAWAALSRLNLDIHLLQGPYYLFRKFPDKVIKFHLTKKATAPKTRPDTLPMKSERMRHFQNFGIFLHRDGILPATYQTVPKEKTSSMKEIQ